MTLTGWTCTTSLPPAQNTIPAFRSNYITSTVYPPQFGQVDTEPVVPVKSLSEDKKRTLLQYTFSEKKMADDLDVEAMLEAPYRKEVSIVFSCLV